MSQFGTPQFGGQRPLQSGGQQVISPPKPTISTQQHPPAAEEPMELISDADTNGHASDSKIRTTSSNSNSVRKDQYKRQPFKTGTGSSRVRSFHGRLSSQGLEYLDNMVNEWLDAHPDIEVKFVTSTVGVFEGKMREPALILNVWY